MNTYLRTPTPPGQKPLAGQILDLTSPLARGLVACYSFNEGCGTLAANAVPGRPHATITGATFQRNGLLFSGTGQKVVAFDPAIGAGDFAAEAMVVLDVMPLAGGGATVMHTDADSGLNGFELLVGGTTHCFQFWLPSAYVNGTTVVQTGQRYHVCLTRLNGVATLYVNGRAEASVASAAAASGGVPLTIGYFSPGIEAFRWKGVIQHARLWSRGLSAAEVGDLALP